MTTRTKGVVTTLAVAGAAVALGPVLFPPAVDLEPSVIQLALLIALGVIEALMLGAAVALAIFGRGAIDHLPAELRVRARVMFWAGLYLMAQWWAHSGLHMTSGLDVDAIVLIDYAFHLPMFVAGGVLTYGVVATVHDVVTGRVDVPSRMPVPVA